eukprot:TRINITY_DN10821_c0_g1_i1.p1 TRINITY_DN10821_c0_g1~~TRINITY_DN10821_c0_g1_i1.p1  ORF type:complete len:210 (-),score=29.34 TRINITY_DN10821_c0_g1_i1:255-824(-)
MCIRDRSMRGGNVIIMDSQLMFEVKDLIPFQLQDFASLNISKSEVTMHFDESTAIHGMQIQNGSSLHAEETRFQYFLNKVWRTVEYAASISVKNIKIDGSSWVAHPEENDGYIKGVLIDNPNSLTIKESNFSSFRGELESKHGGALVILGKESSDTMNVNIQRKQSWDRSRHLFSFRVLSQNQHLIDDI